MLPLELALEPVLRTRDAARPITVSPALEEVERQLLAERFETGFATAPTWLREAYLELASRSGVTEMVPAITNWDIRFDSHGAPRPVASVAAEYAAECLR